MRVTFWGAAGTVTGSMHELNVNGKKYLLDCGVYQGRRKEAEERNKHFPFPARSVDAVVLSHAHIDHSGNLPTLYKNGFHGPIYTTPATVICAAPMLAGLRRTSRRRTRSFSTSGRPARRAARSGVSDGACQPLYTIEDAEATLPLFPPRPAPPAQAVGCRP